MRAGWKNRIEERYYFEGKREAWRQRIAMRQVAAMDQEFRDAVWAMDLQVREEVMQTIEASKGN